jgi:hypothetical protein
VVGKILERIVPETSCMASGLASWLCRTARCEARTFHRWLREPIYQFLKACILEPLFRFLSAGHLEDLFCLPIFWSFHKELLIPSNMELLFTFDQDLSLPDFEAFLADLELASDFLSP